MISDLRNRLGEQAGAQEFHARAAIHLAFEQFQPVNLALHWPVTPRLLDRCLDSAKVLLERPDKTLSGVNACVFSALHPSLPRGAFAVAQKGSKAQSQGSHHGESRAMLLQYLHDFRWLGTQFRWTFHEESRRYLR